jgi:hypothetical protein
MQNVIEKIRAANAAAEKVRAARVAFRFSGTVKAEEALCDAAAEYRRLAEIAVRAGACISREA